jgi:arsenate reductase
MTTVLFCCTGNAVRSPIAEGFARQAFRPDVNVISRGWIPTLSVDEFAVGIAQREGVDISGHRPRVATDQELASADIIVDLTEMCFFKNSATKGVYISLPVPDPSKVEGEISEIGKAWVNAGEIIKAAIEELKVRFPRLVKTT